MAERHGWVSALHRAMLGAMACALALVTAARAEAPQRIVSLLPSLTETVCALGACDRLVGVDRYSNWPPRVRALPQLGGGLDPNVEAIAALRPDLVLVARSARVLPRLQALGLRVEVLEPQTHADVRGVNARVAEVLGLPETRADALWAQIQRDLAQARRSLPAAAQGQRVYFEVNDAPYAAGPESFIGETLTGLGLRNVVPAPWGAFARVSLEWVVAQQPDLVLVGAQGAAQLLQRPGWSQLQALRQRQVCVFPPDQADVLVRAGPRMGQGAQLIADCVRRVLTP